MGFVAELARHRYFGIILGDGGRGVTSRIASRAASPKAGHEWSPAKDSSRGVRSSQADTSPQPSPKNGGWATVAEITVLGFFEDS